jgi:hypothetical protein
MSFIYNRQPPPKLDDAFPGFLHRPGEVLLQHLLVVLALPDVPFGVDERGAAVASRPNVHAFELLNPAICALVYFLVDSDARHGPSIVALFSSRPRSQRTMICTQKARNRVVHVQHIILRGPNIFLHSRRAGCPGTITSKSSASSVSKIFRYPCMFMVRSSPMNGVAPADIESIQITNLLSGTYISRSPSGECQWPTFMSAVSDPSLRVS